MLRLGVVCVVACAPTRDAMLANHAAAPPTHGEIWFPKTNHLPGDPEDRVNVTLAIDSEATSLAGLVWSYRTGRMAPVVLPLGAEGSNGIGYYSAFVREPPIADDYYPLAIVLPAVGGRAVQIAPRDAAIIDQLRGGDIASVHTVETYGLDLDGDGRPDLAAVLVCTRMHSDGVLSPECESYNKRVVRRVGERWMAAPTCRRSSNCGSF